MKHQPQRVGLTHELADEDISERRASATSGNGGRLILTIASHHHQAMIPTLVGLHCDGCSPGDLVTLRGWRGGSRLSRLGIFGRRRLRAVAFCPNRMSDMTDMKRPLAAALL